MKKFLTSDKNFLSSAGEEETFMTGSEIMKLKSEEEPGYKQERRYYCSNCSKSVHNRPDNEKICKGHGCDCMCQAFYIARDGMTLIRYGQKDNTHPGKFKESKKLKETKEWKEAKKIMGGVRNEEKEDTDKSNS